MENFENSTNPENTTVTVTIPAEDVPAPVTVEETAPVIPVDYEALYKNEKTKNKVLFGTGVAVGAGSAFLIFKYRGAMRNMAVSKKARRLEKKAKNGDQKAKKKLIDLYEANESFLKGLIEDPTTY